MSKLNLVKNWRDAATLILAARSGIQSDSYKLLMLKRSAKSKFMPNAYVFPGGVSDSVDFNCEWYNLLLENNVDLGRLTNLHNTMLKPLVYTSNQTTDCLHPEIAFRICALRETFEEAGILLVTDRSGKNIVLQHPDEHLGGKHGTLQGWRDEVNKDENSFLDLFRYLNYSPAVSRLYDWSNWLTPTFRKYRFNTMFYICFLENIVTQSEDNGETVHSDWMTPAERLTGHITNKLLLRIPQIYEHCRFKRHKSFETLMSFTKLREAHGMSTWNPYKVSLTDGFVLTYPGDKFHSKDVNAESAELQYSIAELRTKSEYLNRLEVFEDKRMCITNNVEWCEHSPLHELPLDESFK